MSPLDIAVSTSVLLYRLSHHPRVHSLPRSSTLQPAAVSSLTIPSRSRPASILILRIRPLRRQRSVKQLRLGADDHTALAREAEVRGGGAQPDLAQQLAGGVEDVHAVATAGVHVALRVAVDAVGDAGGNVREGFPIVKAAVVGDLVAVAAWGGMFSWVRVGWVDRWWGKRRDLHGRWSGGVDAEVRVLRSGVGDVGVRGVGGERDAWFICISFMWMTGGEGTDTVGLVE